MNISHSTIKHDPPMPAGGAGGINPPPGQPVVSRHASLEAAFRELAAASPDVMLMHLSQVNVVECALQLKRHLPDSKIIVLAVGDTAGDPLDPATAAARPAPESSGLDRLSSRERAVLALLADGYIYREIARELKVTYATVSTHTRHIYKKLRVHSRAQAVAVFHARKLASAV